MIKPLLPLLLRTLPLLLLLVTACQTKESATEPDPNFHIYLCFGQSNMEGQGVIEAQDLIVSERLRVLQSMDCDTLRKSGSWRTAVPPLGKCDNGLSPADYFGRTMVSEQDASIQVGLINVAVGGCDIRLFDKDIHEQYHDTYKEAWFQNKIAAYSNNPYLHLVNLAKEAQKSGVIKGILLHQGETNTGDADWPKYVAKVYQDLLSDLSLDAKDVPLLAGEVVAMDDSCCASMNEIINALPKTIKTAHVISSEGLTAMDRAHFDSEGYRELGRRYAKKMLSLLDNQ